MLDRVTTGGDGACHLTLSPDLAVVVVAHYGSGTVASFRLGGTGRLSGPLDRFTATAAPGPNRDRQAGPHAHQVVFDGGELLAVDLGTDRVHRLEVGPGGALRERVPALALPPGSGPRHLVVLHDVLVVACELSAELWLARRTGRDWQHTQTLPTTTRTSAGEPVTASALGAEGHRVYVATRGVDTVSVVDVDPATGAAATVAEIGCGGEHRRDLVVARRSPVGGRPALPTGSTS